jgi:hypothetical protein
MTHAVACDRVRGPPSRTDLLPPGTTAVA